MYPEDSEINTYERILPKESEHDRQKRGNPALPGVSEDNLLPAEEFPGQGGKTNPKHKIRQLQ